MLRKLMKVTVCTIIMGVFVLSACQPKATEGLPPVPTQKQVLKVALFINGTLGDKSWFDSEAAGFERAKKELGINGDVIEAGYDSTKWKASLEDTVNSGYDLIFASTTSDILKEVASIHPNQKFVLLDDMVDLPNVYSIKFKQNEGSYLAGILAGLVATSEMPLAIGKKPIVGVVGGGDFPVINDFIVGYKQGALEVDPNIKVLVQYAGAWNDPALGKEIALAQYGQGAVIIFQVAGGTGIGVLEASKEANAYSIGVDSDEGTMMAQKDMAYGDHILTSMLKNGGQAIFNTIQRALEGKVPYGKTENLGIKEGVIGLCNNQYYEKNVPLEIRNKVVAEEQRVLKGEVIVDTALK